MALAVLFSLTCAAQNKSRIVFFRMDMPIGPESSVFKEIRNFTDDLKRNGETIGTLRSHSVLIYETDTALAYYYLANKTKAVPEASKMWIRAGNGRIIFGRIALSDDPNMTQYAEILDSAEFAEYYYDTKWLRKQLDDQGFKSIYELTKGYELPHPKPRPSMEYSYARKVVRNFSDTLFFNALDILTERSNATFYSVTSKSTDGKIEVTNYYILNGKIKSKSTYASLDSESRAGVFTDYYKSGNLQSKGTYLNNLAEGKWEFYYDTVGAPVWYECTFSKGAYEGTLRSYYPNGKVKREELHKTFRDTVFYGSKKSPKSFVREKDSIMSGHCLDSLGKPTVFTPFVTPARPSFDLNAYLARNIHYPDSARRNDLEGRVIVRFGVDSKGQIYEPTIMKGVSDDINREAIRVVKLLPAWKPGMRDDEPCAVVFTLPITFKLED